jgi:DNA repair photolyase
MIISASRRTDIPAFYSDWFMNRIREGWCQVPNPLNYHQLSLVSLKPEDVTTVVFWSKDPAPLMPHLKELDERGFRYYFQFTLNDYGHDLEPGLPDTGQRLEVFRRLSEQLGSLRVVWRYDPLILSNRTPAEFHLDHFSRLANSLRGFTQRVMVSFVDFYRKTDLRLRPLEESGFEFERNADSSLNARTLMKELAQIGKQNSISVFTCAEEADFAGVGVPHGCCIDPELIAKLWSIKVDLKKDPAQRSVCLCAVSKDIGINDTCLHGCAYCYATRSHETAKQRYNQHDPNSPALWGQIRPLSIDEQASQFAARLL